jgi:hypothetical protein
VSGVQWKLEWNPDTVYMIYPASVGTGKSFACAFEINRELAKANMFRTVAAFQPGR